MNFTIELTASPALLEAINNLTRAFAGNAPASVSVPVAAQVKRGGKRDLPAVAPNVAEADTAATDTTEAGENTPTASGPVFDAFATPSAGTKQAPTIEQIRAAVREKGMAGKKDEAKALLDQFGVERIPDLPEDVRADFLAKVEAL